MKHCSCSDNTTTYGNVVFVTQYSTFVLMLKPPVSYTIPFPTHTVGPTAAGSLALLEAAVSAAVLSGAVYASMTIAG
jgi:hypothetical protein